MRLKCHELNEYWNTANFRNVRRIWSNSTWMLQRFGRRLFASFLILSSALRYYVYQYSDKSLLSKTVGNLISIFQFEGSLNGLFCYLNKYLLWFNDEFAISPFRLNLKCMFQYNLVLVSKLCAIKSVIISAEVSQAMEKENFIDVSSNNLTSLSVASHF